MFTAQVIRAVEKLLEAPCTDDTVVMVVGSIDALFPGNVAVENSSDEKRKYKIIPKKYKPIATSRGWTLPCFAIVGLDSSLDEVKSRDFVYPIMILADEKTTVISTSKKFSRMIKTFKARVANLSEIDISAHLVTALHRKKRNQYQTDNQVKNQPPKKARKVTTCGKCGLPKKGHVCLVGVAEEEKDDGDEDIRVPFLVVHTSRMR